MSDVIEFLVPLPPSALRSNSRSGWRAKMAARQAYSRAVFGWWLAAHDIIPKNYRADLPWKYAHVTYTWKHAGVAPDISNIGPNVKALQDVLCMAPNTGKLSTNNMVYLGLIEDDRGIVPEYKLEKVARRAAEGVEIVIRRIGNQGRLAPVARGTR